MTTSTQDKKSLLCSIAKDERHSCLRNAVFAGLIFIQDKKNPLLADSGII